MQNFGILWSLSRYKQWENQEDCNHNNKQFLKHYNILRKRSDITQLKLIGFFDKIFVTYQTFTEYQVTSNRKIKFHSLVPIFPFDFIFPIFFPCVEPLSLYGFNHILIKLFFWLFLKQVCLIMQNFLWDSIYIPFQQLQIHLILQV